MAHGKQRINIRVAVRIRPKNRREKQENQKTFVNAIDRKTLVFDPEDTKDVSENGIKKRYRDITKKMSKNLSMKFDRVFDDDASNDQIFEECVKPLVKSVMKGYNCSVFAYGATGSGKTFTMIGNENQTGITFLTMQELFREINAKSQTYNFNISISYFEVYNEQVKNLLTKSGPLQLLEGCHGVVVKDLILEPIHSPKRLLALLAIGNRNRTQHPTDSNAESSRSHAVVQVHIQMTERKTNLKRTVKLSMIDLAGSERAGRTKGAGVRFKEGASINKSLLAFGNCVHKLARGMRHIPYRDSNLTRILKDSLGGNCRTLMISNVSPCLSTYEDTYNTLRYATRAKNISKTIKKNAIESHTPLGYLLKNIDKYQDDFDKLIAILKQLVQKYEKNGRSKCFHNAEVVFWKREIDAVCSSMVQSQKYCISDVNNENLFKFCNNMNEYEKANTRALALYGNTTRTIIQWIIFPDDQKNNKSFLITRNFSEKLHILDVRLFGRKKIFRAMKLEHPDVTRDSNCDNVTIFNCIGME